MRSLSTLPLAFLGLVALAACGPAANSEADAPAEAEQASEMAVAEAPSLECYVARGTLEEARQRQSPLGETAIPLGGQAAKVCYGRPLVRDRTIFGELHAFGETWRTGANEATALHLEFAANIGGIELEPGSYSIYTIPGESTWEVVINRNFERWGIPIDDAVRADDVGSFSVPVSPTETLVEQLTFSWVPQSESTGHLVMEWENTKIEIPVSGMES
jgi:hypothetical protein